MASTLAISTGTPQSAPFRVHEGRWLVQYCNESPEDASKHVAESRLGSTSRRATSRHPGSAQSKQTKERMEKKGQVEFRIELETYI